MVTINEQCGKRSSINYVNNFWPIFDPRTWQLTQQLSNIEGSPKNSVKKIYPLSPKKIWCNIWI